MMSMETNTAIEIAEEFMAIKKLFEKIGFDLVGTKDFKNDTYYTAKKKEK